MVALKLFIETSIVAGMKVQVKEQVKEWYGGRLKLRHRLEQLQRAESIEEVSLPLINNLKNIYY